ncbi:hypothetical protein JK222_14350 [Gluconobacter cerinus]|uniref:hypothetical protein n=1 Tax=Gluconobacter cerinus TaxID=38307 RepID=UPI001B8BF855|nr:hypothetical protein [Gluconobacter cerinus]MBS1072866.1 hypothetical protein [Gluconobacter cerinus]
MLLVILWGMAFGDVSVAWSNWVAHAVPDQAESAGGIVVVSVQSAIAAGAAVGCLMFSFGGVVGVFGAASAILLFSALLIALRVWTSIPSSALRGRRDRFPRLHKERSKHFTA